MTALRPRWLWIAFAVIALGIPLVGLWLEHSNVPSESRP
jgi:hypothetical protein